MNSKNYTFRSQRSELVEINGQKTYSQPLMVLDHSGKIIDSFQLMCSAISDDIPSLVTVSCVMNWVRKVESGEMELADVDGNAWVINITKEKVWFEGLYSQGEGGEVSLSQFKLAVETYSQLLSDPEHKPIEVVFPKH